MDWHGRVGGQLAEDGDRVRLPLYAARDRTWVTRREQSVKYRDVYRFGTVGHRREELVE